MPCEMIILRLQLCQSLNFGKVYTAKETNNQYCKYIGLTLISIGEKYSFYSEITCQKLNKFVSKSKENARLINVSTI